MIPAEVNSLLGPLSSDTLFALIEDDEEMVSNCRLDSNYGNDALTVTSFSCDNCFAQIRYDVVMPGGYQLGGGSGGSAFVVTSFSGENSYP